MALHDLLLWVPVLIGLGGIAGLLAGMLGVGGGLVLVPGVYFSLSALGYETDHLMHLAVGPSPEICAAIQVPSATPARMPGPMRRTRSIRTDCRFR